MIKNLYGIIIGSFFVLPCLGAADHKLQNVNNEKKLSAGRLSSMKADQKVTEIGRNLFAERDLGVSCFTESNRVCLRHSSKK
ncbi:hypothetical protein HYV10_00785 [Candidatus Dependentiae bacterium]|nr:hypothetical protein [Candidatus Dependentiae bacterium]